MSLISLIVVLIVVGVILWLVNTYIPMDGKIKKGDQVLAERITFVRAVLDMFVLSIAGSVGDGNDADFRAAMSVVTSPTVMETVVPSPISVDRDMTSSSYFDTRIPGAAPLFHPT